MFLKILGSALFLLILPLQSPSTVFAQQATDAVRAAEAQEIPFEFEDGYLISVRGSIGASTNLRFLVDFGTTYTLVDRHFAGELSGIGQADGQGMEVTHFSTSISTKEIVLSEFAIGPIVMKDFHTLVADFSDMPTIPRDIAGIVGLDILQLHNITIDFAEQKLSLSSRVNGRHQAPLETCLVGMAVSATWNGVPVKLAISTGVDVVTLDQDRIKQGSYKPPKLKRRTVSSNFTVTPVAVFETKGLRLSDTGLRGPGVLRRMQWPTARDHLDGFMPLHALGTNRVSLDFERHLLLWDDPAPPTQSARLNTR
jgi:Aspartyl protease